MPLSARSNYGYLSMTPDRPSTSAHKKIHHRPHTTVLNTSALNSRKKSRNKSDRLNTTLPSSQSQRTTNGQIPNYTQSEISFLPKSPLKRDLFAGTYSKSDTDLLNGSDMMAETFDHTVNEISSEIDVILNGIHSGMILTSPSLEGTLKQSTNVDETNSTDGKLSHEKKAIDIEMSSNQCNSTDKALTSLNQEKDEEAAVTIQRWYRQRIRLKEKLRLESLLQQKKNELNRSRNEDVQRTVSKVRQFNTFIIVIIKIILYKNKRMCKDIKTCLQDGDGTVNQRNYFHISLHMHSILYFDIHSSVCVRTYTYIHVSRIWYQ